jgi:hypothetical protein
MLLTTTVHESRYLRFPRRSPSWPPMPACPGLLKGRFDAAAAIVDKHLAKRASWSATSRRRPISLAGYYPRRGARLRSVKTYLNIHAWMMAQRVPGCKGPAS